MRVSARSISLLLFLSGFIIQGATLYLWGQRQRTNAQKQADLVINHCRELTQRTQEYITAPTTLGLSTEEGTMAAELDGIKSVLDNTNDAIKAYEQE